MAERVGVQARSVILINRTRREIGARPGTGAAAPQRAVHPVNDTILLKVIVIQAYIQEL